MENCTALGFLFFIYLYFIRRVKKHQHPSPRSSLRLAGHPRRCLGASGSFSEENGWEILNKTPVRGSEPAPLFTTRALSRHANVSADAASRSSLGACVMDHTAVCICRRDGNKNNLGFIFTEVSGTSVAAKTNELDLGGVQQNRPSRPSNRRINWLLRRS